MLDLIIKSALKQRLLVVALVALVLVWGGITLLKLPIDVFPDLNRPTVTIMTEAGGMDYFESGVANPDVILKDLIKIFYPELLPEHTLFYYQQLK